MLSEQLLWCGNTSGGFGSMTWTRRSKIVDTLLSGQWRRLIGLWVWWQWS